MSKNCRNNTLHSREKAVLNCKWLIKLIHITYYTHAIPAIGKLKQGDYEFQTSLG